MYLLLGVYWYVGWYVYYILVCVLYTRASMYCVLYVYCAGLSIFCVLCTGLCTDCVLVYVLTVY